MCCTSISDLVITIPVTKSSIDVLSICSVEMVYKYLVETLSTLSRPFQSPRLTLVKNYHIAVACSSWNSCISSSKVMFRFFQSAFKLPYLLCMISLSSFFKDPQFLYLFLVTGFIGHLSLTRSTYKMLTYTHMQLMLRCI